MADKIRLRVVTPTRLVIDEEVDEVTAPGELGRVRRVAQSYRLFVDAGSRRVELQAGHEGAVLAISGGYAEVLDNVMTVLATAAEFPAEIDTMRAQRAKDEAEKIMAALNPEEKDWQLAEAALKRSLVRLQVASKETRR